MKLPNRKSKVNVLYFQDGLRLLEDGKPHTLRLWKLSTGEVLCYEDAVCITLNRRAGTHTVRLPKSGLMRRLRDVLLFEIDGLTLYR